MKRGLHRMWIRGLGLCLVVLCNPGCLNDGELCDASQGEVNLDAIRSGVDLSGWWEGGFPEADEVQRLIFIDEEQHLRVWRLPNLGQSGQLEFDRTDYQFGCEEYLSFPLVIGDRNVVPEQRDTIFGGNSWENGHVIELVSVEQREEKLCFAYEEYSLVDGKNQDRKRDFCFWYDSAEDLLYATVTNTRPMVFVRAPDFDPNGE